MGAAVWALVLVCALFTASGEGHDGSDPKGQRLLVYRPPPAPCAKPKCKRKAASAVASPPPPPPTVHRGGGGTLGTAFAAPPPPPSPPPPPPPQKMATAPYNALGSGAPDPIVEQLSGSTCMDAGSTLQVHNDLRARHSAPPLRWNADLAVASGVWARALAQGGCSLGPGHSNRPNGAGENIHAAWTWYEAPFNASCAAAVESWYTEFNDYDFFAPRPFSTNWGRGQWGVGHLTQVLWKGSTQVGCDIGIGTDAGVWNCKVVVCQYLPKGNIGTDQAFKDNVLPPLW